jgi:hypothetical protein
MEEANRGKDFIAEGAEGVEEGKEETRILRRFDRLTAGKLRTGGHE